MLDGDVPSTNSFDFFSIAHFFSTPILDCGRVVEHVKFKILKLCQLL